MKRLSIIYCIILSACNTYVPNENAKLIESELRKEIHISDDVNLYCRCVRMFEDSTGQYLTIERESNSKAPDEIVFYNLGEGKESYRVPIHKEGPNAINGGLYGHSLISRDTLVLTSGYTPDLYMINRNGELIKHYNMDVDRYCSEILQNSFTDTPVNFDNGTAICAQDLPYAQTFDFNDCHIALLLDTATGVVKKSELSYPVLWKMNSKNTVAHRESYSCVKANKDFIYSFMCLDSLMVTRDYKIAKMHYAKSKYATKIKNEGLPRNAPIEERLKVTLGAFYGNAIYDEYRNVIYRFYHFDDYESVGNYGLDQMMSYGEFSIIILNSDYEIIGETRFPRGKYAPRLFYVDKEGLWLSENNYERIGVDMSDSLMVFRCLKLQEVEKN